MPAIKVENLSKEYVIGGAETGRDNLREVLTEALLAPFRRFRRLAGNVAPEERFLALDDVSFEVQAGEALGIIGRNGAGKSTLLKILSRITPPTSGRGELEGRVSSLLEVGTGFHPELTGRENIFLNGTILGMSRAEIRRRFDEIVAFSEIEKFLDTPVKRYSSGMYVRLAFSVAAHLDPEILIVDEVLAVGDGQFQKKCLGKIGEVGKEGRTVIFVSHNLGAVRSLCSRAILLRNGRTEFDGDVFTAVGRYTHRESADVGVVEWPREEAPSLPSASLVEVGILGDGDEAGTDLSTEHPIRVYVRFRVEKEAEIGTSVLLHNSDGMMLFSSLSNHEPRWHGKRRPQGVYRSVCEIPANFLAAGEYTVSIGFWEGHYRAGVVEKEVLRFTAHEKGLVRGDLPYEIKGVVTLPLLPWRSEREE